MSLFILITDNNNIIYTKSILVQPNRDMPIDEVLDETIDAIYIKECNDELEQANKIILKHAKSTNSILTFESLQNKEINKKIIKVVKKKPAVVNIIDNINVKVENKPTKRMFNPRLPIRLKNNVINLENNINFDINSINFPTL